MTQPSPATPIPDITITRSVEAPPARVFAAWTEPARFAHWFGTAATTVRDVEMDVRPGGSWSALMVLPDGQTQIHWHGAYVEVDAPVRLVLTLSDNAGDLYDVVTVDLLDTGTEAGPGTEMTFTQSGGHMPAEAYQAAEQGWRAFFDDLATGL